MSCRICGQAIMGRAIQSHSLTRRRPGGLAPASSFHPLCLKRVQQAQLTLCRQSMRANDRPWVA